MNKSDKPALQDSAAWSIENDPTALITLIADLGNRSGIVRVKARRSLVAMGSQAVGQLTEALTSKVHWVRWEAAKALGQIGDPSAAWSLVRALEDDMFDVRCPVAGG
jgi:HEAT repeat protein